MFMIAAHLLRRIGGRRHALSIYRRSMRLPIARPWMAAVGFFVSPMLPYCAWAEDQPRIIRLSTQSPADSPSIQSLVHFKQKVEADSQGGLRIEIYHSGKLYPDGRIGAAVSSGAVEMGYVNLGRYAETILIADAFELPFLFNTAELEKAARAPGSEIRQLIEEAVLSQTGSRVLWWVPEGQIVFFAKGVPVANPERLAGKTVRIVGPMIETAVRMCGGEPKDIAGTEQMKAYERNEVDIGMSSVATVLGRKIYKVMDTVTRTNHASAEFVVVINENVWQSLSNQQRAILAGAADSAGIKASDVIAEIEANANRQLAENGAKVVTLSDDELIAWRICSSDVLTEFMSQTGELGQRLMEAYGRLRRDGPSQGRRPSASSN
jgi:C4-dicarboxylate-binding protein DctP